MKIYTQTGDRGKTGLFSGERVPKSHQRIEAYGDVDELNAVLGALRAHLRPDSHELIEELVGIQSELFHIGAWLATTPGSPSAAHLKEISMDCAKDLELSIDRMENGLPPLKDFILPGGHITAAWAHVARTVCRRAERHVVRLSFKSADSEGEEKPYWGVIMFLNRLSDYLFMLARYLNRKEGVDESLWKK